MPTPNRVGECITWLDDPSSRSYMFICTGYLPCVKQLVPECDFAQRGQRSASSTRALLNARVVDVPTAGRTFEFELHRGDCLELMRQMPENSIDAIVCDPPYGLSDEPDPVEVLTNWLAGDDYSHRGSGFMGKSWDSFVPGPAVWREARRVLKPGGHLLAFFHSRTYDLGTIAVRLAGFEIQTMHSWWHAQGKPPALNLGHRLGFASNSARSTAVKPAQEPIVMARKPLSEPAVLANVECWGTGALNIDDCRIPAVDAAYARNCSGDRGYAGTREQNEIGATNIRTGGGSANEFGRWPANVMLDEHVAQLLDAERPEASKYFFVSRPSNGERDAGTTRNVHVSVKPIALMRHLVRLVCPSGGTVLDPYLGSGTTGCAAALEPQVARFIGIELDVDDEGYLEIADDRITYWQREAERAA